MKNILCLASLPLALATPAFAQEEPAPVTPTSVVADAAPEEWLAIPAEDLLVMELAPDASGQPRIVVIQLIPAPFSQPWVANIRTLAAAHWWDGTSVNRVQDNYVTQWGDVTEAKPLPEGLDDTAALEYESEVARYASVGSLVETEAPRGVSILRVMGDEIADPYNRSGKTGWLTGFPIGFNRDLHWGWPIHCYGYVGVGRGYAPDTGTGAELYTIIGQPQRHMDRNLAVVGRIIEGAQHLSSLPRGSGDLGFYTEDEAHLRTPIVSVRLGSDLETPPAFEYLDTSSESFARYVTVRANRDDPFYTVPAGGVDVCSVEVPVRRTGE